MPQVLYTAIIERAADGYSAYLPDVPGCVSAGLTIEETVQNVEEALAGHIAELVEGGDPIPDPSDPAGIQRDPESDEVARFLVRADLPGRSVRINVTIDEGLIAAIDKVARNRSGFLAQAAREALARMRAAT